MKQFDVRRLDVQAFADDGGRLAGEDQVGQHPRLMAETQGQGAERLVRWSAQGELRGPDSVQPEVWLRLKADTMLPMVCQRCLTPVDMPVAVDRPFRFVADEDTAAAQDDAAEEDLLAMSRSFDLMELIEDELLMELPVAPRHAVCPEPVRLEVADPEFEAAAQPSDNPFAVLGKLRAGKS